MNKKNICKKCNNLIIDYTKNSIKRNLCLICFKELNKIYYENNKNKILKYKKDYYKNNIDNLKNKNKKYYENNKEILLLNNNYYRENNKHKINNQRKKYRISNKEKILNRVKNYEKNKLLTDPLFKIKKNLSKQMRMYVNKHNENIFNILNYSVDDLRNHLESLFESWMTWNNYGSYTLKWDDNDVSTWKWNIDHIIPQSNFKYSSINDEEFKKCWCLENLRPFSAKQNVLDGNKRLNK